MTRRYAYAVLATILVVVLAAAYVLLSHGTLQLPQSQTTTQTQETVPQPPTPEVAAYLAQSHGFQYLVSFTDRGFEPGTLAIKKGETVRWTNNSSRPLWVAAAGTESGHVYPAGTSNECGQSAFDSCKTIARGEFWEFTFDAKGTWGYHNNSNIGETGTITVR